MKIAEQSTAKFIEIVKSHNILWDLTNPNYKNIKKKAAVWKNVSEEFGLPTDACKKKWKGLRDSFSRDLNKKPVFGTEPEYTWKYRDQMEFIKGHINSRLKKNKLSKAKVDDGGSDSLAALSPTADVSFLFCSPSSQIQEFDNTLNCQKSVEPIMSVSQEPETRQIIPMETTYISTMEMVQDYMKKPRQSVLTIPIPSDPDEDELFCQSLVKKIRNFPRDLKNQAKLEMLRYLNEVENMLPTNLNSVL